MKAHSDVRKYLAVVALSLLLLPQVTAARSWSEQSQCEDVRDSGTLRVLTLNILFSEYPLRDFRLGEIVRFLVESDGHGEPVHVVALQEVVGGLLDELLAPQLGGTPVDRNTARELKNRLSSAGLNYNLRIGLENGLPGIFSVSNATLSLCAFKGLKLVKRLPKVTEIEIGDLKVEVGRNVLLTRLAVPGFGKVDVANTHLCSSCGPRDRSAQVNVALDFIDNVQSFAPTELVLFVGDFNTGINQDGETTQTYQPIIEAGFVDTYARVHADDPDTGGVFCGEGADRGCTVGVSDIEDPFDTDPGKNRIDFVFARQQSSRSISVQVSKVIFNPDIDNTQTGVSDHSAVLTEFDLRQ